MAVKRFTQKWFILNARMLFLFLVAGAVFGCQNGSTPQPSPVLSPTLLTSPTPGLPDLVITDITLESDSSDPCSQSEENLFVGVHVQNQGQSDSGPFIITINNTWQNVNTGLAAGQSLTLWFSGFQEEITVQIDPSSQVIESREDNNLATRQFSLPMPPSECFQTPTPEMPRQEALAILKGHIGKVQSVDFSPDGALLASGASDDTLRLWRVQEQRLLRTMMGHPFPVLVVRFSPNGALLSTGSSDSLIRLWRVSDGFLMHTLPGHAGWVKSLDFSPDSRFLVSSGDFTVHIWRISDGKLVQTIDEGMSTITDIAFSPDGQTLGWSESDGSVRLRSLSGQWLHTLQAGSQPASQMAFSPQGGLLAAGYGDGTIRIWSEDDGIILQSLNGHSSAISSLVFSPEGRWLVSGSQDGTLRLWQKLGPMFDPNPAAILQSHEGAVNDIAYSPDGTLIASASDDLTIRLWWAPQGLPPGPSPTAPSALPSATLLP